MSNLTQIIEQIKSEITVDAIGRGKSTLRGTARLADVEQSSLTRAFMSDAQSPSKLAEYLISKGFESDAQKQWCKDGIPDLAVSVISDRL